MTNETNERPDQWRGPGADSYQYALGKLPAPSTEGMPPVEQDPCTAQGLRRLELSREAARSDKEDGESR